MCNAYVDEGLEASPLVTGPTKALSTSGRMSTATSDRTFRNLRSNCSVPNFMSAVVSSLTRTFPSKVVS